MRPSILALKLLAIFIYYIIVGTLVHQVNGLVADDIIIGTVLNVDLSQVLTVVTLSLGEHAALLVIRKLQLKFLSILVKFNVGSFIFISLCEKADAVALSDYSSYATIAILIFLIFTVIFILILILIQEHIILSMMIVQVVLLLFGWEAVEIDILVVILIVSFAAVLNKLHIPIYRQRRNHFNDKMRKNWYEELTVRCEKCRIAWVTHHLPQLFGIYIV